MESAESSGPLKKKKKRTFETMMNDSRQPTPYELDVFNMAMQWNTIAHLDTGAGKTMIALMIMKEVALSLNKQPSEKKLIVFLAPTRDLVEQKFDVVKRNTNLLADFYHGSKVTKIDGKKVVEWDAATWEHQTNKNEVMVMTPQILLDALRKAFMSFEIICLLIIDECHHARGNHPYASIMKELYHKSVNKPKVFGMTASPPVTKKGVFSAEARITKLESTLDSLIYTIQNRAELENVTPSASLISCINVEKGEHSILWSEQSMKRDLEACVAKQCNFKETESSSFSSYVDARGASVTVEDHSENKSSKKAKESPSGAVLKLINTQKGGPRATLYELCNKMNWPKPILTSYEQKSKSFSSFESSISLTFPDCDVIQVMGEPRANKKSSLDSAALLMLDKLQRHGKPETGSSSFSKQHVFLEASKMLHQMGALTDHVLPNNEDPTRNKSSRNTKKSPPPGAGTTKRKELHGKTAIRALSGAWGDDCADLYAYKISFKCSSVDVKYSSFVFLLESKLDDEVANLEVELYLVSECVNCKVSSCGKLHLNAEQVAKGKCFQELFFNGIFGKLYVGSKKSQEPREFLLGSDKKLWNSSCMYFLLPLESLDPFKISWREIDSCISAIEFVNKSSFSRAEKQSVDSIMTSTNMIHFANRSVHKDDVDDVTNVLVLAIHTGKIYSIFEIAKDETAHSPFDGDTRKFSSFKNYFKQMYEIDLVYPGQNMLVLTQSHRAHNLLVDFNGILHGKKIKAKSCKVSTDRQRRYARLPPELLVIIDARIEIVKSLYLLPSLMHRVESLMLASQLREEITGHMTDIHISLSSILEAITTLRCNESFSMERLELLGDSVLKYVVSCDLYLRYPKRHEGKLSSDRSLQVCNSTLYNLGIGCQLQSYIRDTTFDPTRWTAPGQLPLRPCPCDHGVETIEVPTHAKYHTEDPKVLTGKCCDTGHRWLVSKTISDCVEALIGAYFAGNGLTGALHCMKWLGISCELDPSRVNEAIKVASLHAYALKLDVLKSLESQLGYEFSVKGLLLEAITHASNQDRGGGYCYQRLEFLGDSVLDLLITRHLFNKHTDIDPGELTDLRSASVNNENFAYAAVRRNLHTYLQYRSGALETQISDYIKFVATNANSLQTKKSPKALGDLVEGIAGAILLDTRLNLDQVWRIFELLLAPIVTPEKLKLPPLRVLLEFCNSKGYFIKDTCGSKGDVVIAELRLQLEDALLIAEGTGNTKKVARGQAARNLLSQLEKSGISRKNHHQVNIDEKINNKNMDSIFLMEEESNSKTEIPVALVKSIDTKKGGPRSSLYQVCKKMHWPMAIFTSSHGNSKTLIETGDKRTTFNSFESRISLTIPRHGVIELTGEPQTDKKTSFDSAALLMLYELQKHGILKIG